MGRGRGLLILMVSHFLEDAVAREPGQGSYQLRSRIEDCALYRAAFKRVERYFQETKEQESAKVTQVDQRWKLLKACIKGKKIPFRKEESNDKREILVAFMCPQEYQNWIHPGLELEELRRTLQQTTKQRDSIHRMTQRQCPKDIFHPQLIEMGSIE